MTGQRILVLGTGPTHMGQGFEYNSATAAACRTLREMGNTVILLESHISSLAADQHVANTTYLEPLNRDTLERIYNSEAPHRIYVTAGGQRALTLALLLHQMPHGLHKPLSFFGNSGDILEATQNKERFIRIVQSFSARTPQAYAVTKHKQGMELGRQLGFPVVVRASLALNNLATAITYNSIELHTALEIALKASATGEAIIEKSLAGYKRTEWQMIRDVRNDVRTIGTIEYIEPLGIHSNDSPAVSPIQTLSPAARTRSEQLAVQAMRGFKLTGTATVQLAHGSDPDDIQIVKVTPRITSTALWCGRVASIPIVDWHTRICIGSALEDLSGHSAKEQEDLFSKEKAGISPPPFCWCRMPRFPGQRLMDRNEQLTTYTKSVGWAAGVDCTFLPAFLKAIRAAGYPFIGPGCQSQGPSETWDTDRLKMEIARPAVDRLWYLYSGLRSGIASEELHELTGIDAWFIRQLETLWQIERSWQAINPKDVISATDIQQKLLKSAKQAGCSDAQLAESVHLEEERLAQARIRLGILPRAVQTDTTADPDKTAVFRTCTYADAPKVEKTSDQETLLILGSGNSILADGAESEYSIAEAVREFHALGSRCVLIAPNPLHLADEADVPVKHYLDAIEPETLRSVAAHEKPAGIVLQFSECCSPELIACITELNIPVLGTSIKDIERMRKRDRLRVMLQKLNVRQPAHGVAGNAREAYTFAQDIGYPVIVHPANPVHLPRIAIWYDQAEARQFLEQAPSLYELYPIAVEKFLEDAREFNLDGIADGEQFNLAGVVEYVEEAGINAADSAAVWPVRSISPEILDHSRQLAASLVKELHIHGIIGIKFAVRGDELFLIDLQPRVTRCTVLLHKLTGCRLIPHVVRVLAGASLADLEWYEAAGDYRAVRAPVYAFKHFPACSALLSPEKCSVGEAVGIDQSFGIAYAKALTAAGNVLPTKGTVLLAVADRDKEFIIPVAKKLRFLGFSILATEGTARELLNVGVPFEEVHKIHEGRPNVIDRIIDGDIHLIINTPGGKANRIAEDQMRKKALEHGILVITTISGAYAAVEGIEAFMQHGFDVTSVEKHQRELRFQREIRFEQQETFNFDT